MFWGYLLAALLIGFCWLKWQNRTSSRETLKALFRRQVWWSASARADYALFLINRLSFLLLAPLLLTQLTLANWLFLSLYEWFGYRPVIGAGWPAVCVAGLFTLCLFLLDDFSRFYLHKLLHEVPALWAFHQVHHSARTLTPITVFRTHPVEGILFSLRSTLVQAVSIALFVFFFGERADLITFMGAALFTLLFNLSGSNLRHSHVGLRYGRYVEKWLISPAQHQIHHSTDPQHFDKNYGVVLALWDRLWGTLVLSEKGQQLAFGLSHRVTPGEQSLWQLYWGPFRLLWRMLIRRQGSGTTAND
ncbi:sterol desaturase family protein [Neptuniibacter halophilus]|uniref:sterol desaturase family protein n=1 Tax=Neptuniibacter halophilus TaxID=651666 RepID=UPI002573F0BF|nr:sterol desaturase family protein [Neptuniibacter halophilus]